MRNQNKNQYDAVILLIYFAGGVGLLQKPSIKLAKEKSHMRRKGNEKLPVEISADRVDWLVCGNDGCFFYFCTLELQMSQIHLFSAVVLLLHSYFLLLSSIFYPFLSSFLPLTLYSFFARPSLFYLNSPILTRTPANSFCN